VTECFAQGRLARASERSGIGCGGPARMALGRLKTGSFLELTADITDRFYLSGDEGAFDGAARCLE
jgi:hypothetical protein